MTQALGTLQKALVVALRSGQYPQTQTGDLHNNEGYSVLGLAQEIVCAVQPTTIDANGVRWFCNDAIQYDDDGNPLPCNDPLNPQDQYERSDVLTDYVAAKMAFITETGNTAGDQFQEDNYQGPGDGTDSLWWLGRTKAFAEVADIIEADPSVYFLSPA